METHPQVSIIIVNHRSRDVLGDCLKAVAAGRGRLEVEVIIVDNPAEEKSPLPSDIDGLLIRRRPLSRRYGFAAAANAGAEIANGEFLLFLNPDLILEKSALANLHRFLQEHEDAGAATGRLQYPDGTFQPSCRHFPRMRNLLFSRGSVLKRRGSGSASYTLPDFGQPTEVEAAAAAMFLISKKTFDGLGGFDVSFFMYLEDTDLCLRLRRSGEKVFFVPAAEGIHLWGHSTRPYRFRRLIWHHVSMGRFFFKHHRLPEAILITPFLVINGLLSLVIELFSFCR